MFPQATTLRRRAPTIVVRPIKRTILKKRKINVESFEALSRTLGPLLKIIIGIYNDFTCIASADQVMIRERVLAQIWRTKTRIRAKEDAGDYVLHVVITKVHDYFREIGCPEKPAEISLQMRVEHIAQS